MAKTKRVDPIKQREKRAKIAAAIGGVVLLAVAAIEIPPLMKSSSPPPSASHSTATTPTTAPTTGTAAATSAPAAGELADTDAPPPVEPGELVSFSMFQSKNPFTPQVTTPADGSTQSTPAPTTAQKQGAGVPATSTTPTSTTTTPATATLPTTTVPAGTAGVVPSASATAVAPGPTVAISVNGGVSHVATDGTFPDASPVFRLVSYTKGTAEIGIVGGSYAAGGATLTLHLHTPVTLENQTDGKRYTLELDSTP
jgi:hypothetical protein